ncbi:MAG: NADH-quinone oxidoreductase subunit NuoK [Nitrospirae bacterium]|nr:NADH-quinone oxidoreductase subunit NuoK [Nitrospirota bacterium]MBI3352345.1 NADH-quinone oxidoreductase subunit NuoK [Nitrospirota bacterium]
MVPLSYYIILSSILFMLGVAGVLIRRNIVTILLSIEMMLNATNINFVAFSHYLHNITGQVFVFFVLSVAAAEVVIGLAIIIALYKNHKTLNVDQINLMKW